MEKTDQRETRDFMNVESFSQLPFIRPSPPLKMDKSSGIRLFGKEFGGEFATATDDSSSESAAAAAAAAHQHHQANNSNNGRAGGEESNNNSNGESTRKFECHYCCRNFPTSQALGGHQNAHKRERQHAKRAHLQSAMVHAHGGALAAEAHVYGLMNYHHHHRLASVPSSALANYHHNHLHSWSKPNGGRYYGSYYNNNNSQIQPAPQQQQQPQPINGSPLGLWRIPAASTQSSPTHHHGFNRTVLDDPMHHHHNQLPLLGNGNGNGELKKMKPQQQVSSASHQTLLGYDSSKPSNKMQDPVSLDLHL